MPDNNMRGLQHALNAQLDKVKAAPVWAVKQEADKLASMFTAALIDLQNRLNRLEADIHAYLADQKANRAAEGAHADWTAAHGGA